jgi:hypothetical protein
MPFPHPLDAKHLLKIEPTSTARLEANLLFALSAYSTVTDLAKLRGWSTSVPMNVAVW